MSQLRSQPGSKRERILQNVVVVFEATQEATESLALALGLGAVQQGANIRLRHLDPSPTAKLAHQSYGRLKVDDLCWAEGIAIVLETGNMSGLEEIAQSLDQLSEKGDLVSKVGYVFGENADSEPLRLVQEKLRATGVRLLREDQSDRAATPAYMNKIGQRLAGEKI
jgi:hypothetical protein